GQVPILPTGAMGWAKPAIKDSPDLRRVLALPRRPQPSESMAVKLIERITGAFAIHNDDCKCSTIRPNAECILKLRLSQAWALNEIYETNGVLGGIGVGHGKTLLGILAPLAIKNCKTALLLIPTNLT